MQETAQRAGITFAVDAVTPAESALPEIRAHEGVKCLIGSNIESCSDYHGTVIKDVRYQPLLAAVYTAFSQHRPLVLTPDAVWITIAQGVAHHMALHGERLRPLFVNHANKLDLVFECTGWVKGSPENPWSEAFSAWAGQIRDHVGVDVHDALICDFGTSGPVERAASQVVMMDVFERYFHYVMYCICGIPTITLTGTPDDWERLAEKAARLAVFDLDWWLEHLLPICRQFVLASRGEVDVRHWQAICKRREEYGGDVINGWIAKLFPYLRAFINGPCTKRNEIFETGEGFQTASAPPGLSRVPFTWIDGRSGETRSMEAIGGLVGVSQDSGDLALQPKVGWGVREAEKMDVLLTQLAERHTTFPVEPAVSPKCVSPDLAKFYHRTNGAEMFGRGGAAAYRIVARNELERLDWGPIGESLSDNDYPNGQIWYRLAFLSNGSWLAINPRPQYSEEWRERFRSDPGGSTWDSFVAICHCDSATTGKAGANPVVAVSFTELLERLLASGGAPYWLDSEFAGYGDAEEFTRRA